MLKKSALFVACCVSHALGQFGSNLVENPSFEEFILNDSGVVQVSNSDQVPGHMTADLTGWVVIEGGFTLDRYDGVYAPATGVPEDAGTYYLFGDFGPRSAIEQTIELVFAQKEIDSDAVRFEFEALLGSFVGGPHPESQDDIATVFLAFLDGTGVVLDEIVVIGPRVPSDVGLPDFNADNFQFPFLRNGRVAPGARSLVVTVDFVRDLDVIPTGFNNANADRLRLALAPRCLADLDSDGLLSLADVIAFVNAFVGGELIVDFDSSGLLDLADITAFTSAFLGECI